MRLIKILLYPINKEILLITWKLFCICIQLLNKTWREMRASEEDFPKVYFNIIMSSPFWERHINSPFWGRHIVSPFVGVDKLSPHKGLTMCLPRRASNVFSPEKDNNVSPPEGVNNVPPLMKNFYFFSI
jgi:hypothetical protein